MWLFEQRGFMSVVAYDPKKDRNKASKFSEIAQQAGTHLLVRARIKEDLDVLKTVVPKLHIEEDPAADYSFRCVIPRNKFKRFLANAVDDIDYDSHFKEVVKARSPEVNGRYNAMMSVWTTMANLQPFAPYGAYGSHYSNGLWGDDYGGYSGYAGSSSKNKGSGSNKGKASSAGSSPGVATGSTAAYGKEGTVDDKRGYETLDDFKQAWLDGDLTSPMPGDGPRTGYTKGDIVEGYFGTGEVLDVETGRKEGIDKVRVKVKKGAATTFSWFLSTYLIPHGLPVPDEGVVSEYDFDIDGLYSYLMEHDRTPDHFPPEHIADLTEDGWEYLTRLQEHLGTEEKIVSYEDMNRIYDELIWEGASDKERLQLVADDKVPEKYQDEALRLPIFSEK